MKLTGKKDIVWLEVEWRVPWCHRHRQILEMPPGVRFDQVPGLAEWSAGERANDILLVFDGKSVLWEDPIFYSGRVLVLPLLSGG